MNIELATGVGTGNTTLSAFDAALDDAGVSNYNLIRLSSVIPPASNIVIKKEKTHPSGDWGDRLYVVMAEKRIDTPNQEAWAGIGWVQDKKTGKGLFVEHEGSSQRSVKKDIKASLQGLMATRNIDFGPIHMKVVGKTCLHMPVCALVVAVFEHDNWDTI